MSKHAVFIRLAFPLELPRRSAGGDSSGGSEGSRAGSRKSGCLLLQLPAMCSRDAKYALLLCVGMVLLPSARRLMFPLSILCWLAKKKHRRSTGLFKTVMGGRAEDQTAAAALATLSHSLCIAVAYSQVQHNRYAHTETTATHTTSRQQRRGSERVAGTEALSCPGQIPTSVEGVCVSRSEHRGCVLLLSAR